MNVEILSVGSATPPHELSQSEALAMAQRICCSDARQARFAGVLYEHAGITRRHTVLPHDTALRWVPDELRRPDDPPNYGPTTEERMAFYEEFALPLALQASGEALGRSGVSPREITHVVTASCTGFTAPGVDSGLIRGLELRPTTVRVHVGYMGCHGAINALRVAHGLAHTDPRARVLVCAVELCSLHYAFHWDHERMLANALFADGAGAIVVGAAGNEPLTKAERWRIAATGSCLFPGTEGAMTWRVGNHGFTMTISSQLPSLLKAHLSGWLTAWLDEQGLRPCDVRSWGVHPGGPRILEAVESAMQLRPELTQVSRDVLACCGNMSSATIVFILKSLVATGAPRPCVLLGFGPGLVAEAALLLD